MAAPGHFSWGLSLIGNRTSFRLNIVSYVRWVCSLAIAMDSAYKNHYLRMIDDSWLGVNRAKSSRISKNLRRAIPYILRHYPFP